MAAERVPENPRPAHESTEYGEILLRLDGEPWEARAMSGEDLSTTAHKYLEQHPQVRERILEKGHNIIAAMTSRGAVLLTGGIGLALVSTGVGILIREHHKKKD